MRKAALAVYFNMIESDSTRQQEDPMPSSMNSSILKLNVGGKDISIRKGSILPRTSPDSLFGILASGRWDNHLTKDRNGRIFLDIDPEWIEVVINVLRESSLRCIGGHGTWLSCDTSVLQYAISILRLHDRSV